MMAAYAARQSGGPTPRTRIRGLLGRREIRSGRNLSARRNDHSWRRLVARHVPAPKVATPKPQGTASVPRRGRHLCKALGFRDVTIGLSCPNQKNVATYRYKYSLRWLRLG